MKINAPLALFLVQFFSICVLNGQTPTGGWGNCEFATVVSMNAFDPSGSTYTCKKAYVTATDEHYRWNGSAWVLESADVENIYNTSDTLTSDRTVTHENFDLNFDLTGNGDFRVYDNGSAFFSLKESGRIGLWTDSPSNPLHAINTVNTNPFYFESTNVLTGERDVFTIEDSDTGGGGQDHSSVLKVWKSATINSGDFGASLVELIYGTSSAFSDPGDGKYWISGRRTDEGAPEWGVNITGNQIWSSGGILLNATGATDGTYSGGNFIVESDGDVGIGTATPATRLEVDGGTVRLSDYGAGTRDSIDTYVLSVGGLGDVQEMSFSELADSLAGAFTDNTIYSTDGTLASDRVVTMDGNDLTFDGTRDVSILDNGNVGIGITTPASALTIINNDNNYTNDDIEIASHNAGGIDYAPGLVLKRGRGTYASPTNIGNGDRIGRLGFYSYYNSSGYGLSSYIQSNYTGTGTNIASDLIFGTSNAVGMYIADNGFVGLGTGTATPAARLELSNGTLRLSDYGAGAVSGTATRILAVDTNGDVIEEDLTNASGTGALDNIYSANGTLQADRTVTMSSGRDLTFESSSNSRFLIDGFSGSNFANPIFQIDRDADRDLRFYHADDNNNGFWKIGTNDGIAFELDNTDNNGLYINSSGDVGIGNSSPAKTLEVTGGDIRLSNYGVATYETGNETYLLGVEADGDVVEIDPASLGGGSATNIYNTDGTLTGERTMTMGSNDMIFDMTGTGDFLVSDNGTPTLAVEGPNVGIGEEFPDAPLHIVESTGTPASASDGSIVLEHADSGGSSSVVFKSAVNSGSDYAYIEFSDDGSGNGSTTENALLTIGIENDGPGIYQDDIAIMPSGNLGVGTTTPAAKLEVDGGSVRLSDYGNTTTYLDTATASTAAEVDFVLGVDSEGDVFAMNTAKSSKIFYPPPIVVDASSTTTFTVDLHAAYVAAFTGPSLISSNGAPTAIPTYASDELFYYITDYDNSIFTDVEISISGVLSYRVTSVPTDDCSIFNVVFVVK